MEKIVGFDIDGVLTDGNLTIWENELINYYDLKPNTDATGNLSERYRLTEEQMLDFFTQRSHSVFPQLTMRPGADKLLQQLKADNFTIILITARTESEETLRWLERHQIPYDKIIHQEQKLKPCLQNQLELFVEDNLRNARDISTKIPVLLMNTKHNQEEDLPEQVFRVHDFSEIAQYIYQHFSQETA